MKVIHTKQRTAKLCGLIVFTLLLVLIPAFAFDFYYDLNDDTTIKDIVSGAYTGTPSGYSIQMLYPLSWLISILYRAIPALPWYGLVLCVCQFGVILLVARRLLYILGNERERVISLVLLLVITAGLYIRELVIIQYSVTSAICMTGAVFLFTTSDNGLKASDFVKSNIVAILLVIISFMIRTEMCLLLMPFLLLIGLMKWGSEDKIFTATNFKKYLLIVAFALVGMLAAYSVDRVAYNGTEWISFGTFFDARTDLYDFYELPNYDENEEFYSSLGLSRESYTLLENYNFALDESIDSWMLKSISDYQRQNAGVANNLKNTFGFISKNSVKEALWLYEHHVISVIMRISSDSILEYVILFLYIITIMLSLLMGKGNRICVSIWWILSLVFIRSVLWLYLYMVDRVIDRVTVPLLMTEMCILLMFVMGGLKSDMGNRIKTVICTAVIVITALLAVESWNETSAEMSLRAAADERWNALCEYCAGNIGYYYVIDVYSSTSYNGASYSEKIFKNVDNSYKNYDICGGWTAKSPLMRQKLSNMGLKYIQSALYTQRAFFVAAVDKDVTWLTRYYSKRGYNVEPVCVDTICTQTGEAAFYVYGLTERLEE